MGLQEKVASRGPVAHYLAAVGAVDLVQCEAASGDGGRDQFYAKIRWSSASAPGTQPVNHATVFRYGREGRPKTDGGLSHAHCPECLGPLSESDVTACEYCGAALASGRSDWVLEDLLQPFEMSAHELRAQAVTMPGERETQEVPAWALPDLSSQQERKLLKTASKRWAIPFETVNPILFG